MEVQEAILAATWASWGPQILPKMVPKSVEIEVWGGLEALGGAWGAPWSQDGAQERQKEPQEAPRWPTWRQHGPTWLENGVPNPLKID